MIESIVYTVEGTLTVEYTYNYLGDRITKTVDGVTTYYTLDYSSGLSQVIEEATNSKTVFYVRGLELISREETRGTYFYILDGGNTVRALVDEEGNVTDKYIFDSFGNEISHEGDSSNSYGFQGEQLDDETGLYYLRARYMNPTTGTFTSMDTYGGTLSDPASLHKYLFANSNPIKYSDPTGHVGTLIDTETAQTIMAMLESAAENLLMYCFECCITNEDVTDEGIFIALTFGLFSGYCGNHISKALGLEGTLSKVGGKIRGCKALEQIEILKICAILIFAASFIPTGIALKNYAYNTENPYLAEILGGLGDTLLDTAYEIISYALGIPPQSIPIVADIGEALSR